MEEELNEHDLEERLYAMLHHVDETQNNLIETHQNKCDPTQFLENGPRSTVRRYWRSGPDNNLYHKVNTPKSAPAATKIISTTDNSKPEDEKNSLPKVPSPVDLSIFQSPIPPNAKKTIEFLDHEANEAPVVLESSDEDEVVEIALPPKPTITIESSDEDDLHIIKPQSTKSDPKANLQNKSNNCSERAVSASPVPSVVSSVSDEFIRGDCIALNISSRHPDKHSFDFSLHGSDLLVQNTPSKKKKRKKNKEAVTSTPIIAAAEKTVTPSESCFATPRSKAKNKKQKSKLFTQKSIPTPDVFNSDSNLSIVDSNKNNNLYVVTEKSLPSVDVYESDSNQSEIVKEINIEQSKNKNDFVAYNSDSSISNDKPEQIPKSSKKNNTHHNLSLETVDLTDKNNLITLDNTGICESIVMANVTGLPESLDHGDDEPRIQSSKKDISKYVSSKVPSILNEDLDFDNLKGKEKICKRRPYSPTTLRAEMEKFYNESWGGEDFNHREIQKNMSRDKNLWAIDPKDRMSSSFVQRKPKCNYCNRPGHRDDLCRQRPPVCFMCGNTGHFEPRCPTKICVNCGTPNFMYSTMCRNCSTWPSVECAECGQRGHPSSHCPDLWRRYHNTTDTNVSLEMCNIQKKYVELFCSGCSRRGHLVHTCHTTLPFSGLPVNSPYVRIYRPTFPQTSAFKPRSKSFSQEPTATTQRPDRNKRLSKSPTVHEDHSNKKRHLSVNTTELKTPVPQKNPPKEVDNTKSKSKTKSMDSSAVTASIATEKAPDFISVNSSNHDNKGHVIQDNEVSDTSDAVTSSRIYITNDITKKLKLKDGEDWLKATTEKLNLVVEHSDINSFLTVKGKLADQEAFQTKLREWAQPPTDAKPTNDVNPEEPKNQALSNIPKNRNNLLRQLSKALDSLKEHQGDPRALYKELTFSQNKHEKLLKQKVISPVVLSNSRNHINNTLKKLNMILLGQAGLANGSEHVNVLLSFKEMLINSRQKTVSPSVRKKIGEHFHSIFSPTARDDYMELVNKYYMSASNLAKKKKRKQVQHNHKSTSIQTNNTQISKNNSIPPKESTDICNVVVKRSPNTKMWTFVENEKANLQEKLCLYHNRLSLLKDNSKVQKKITITVRQLHSLLIMLCKNDKISSKVIKKINRAQDQAKKFLAK